MVPETACPKSIRCPSIIEPDTVQVEARLRQLEGRELEGDAIMHTPSGPSKYDSSKPDGSLVAVTPATYNADADVAMDETPAAENGSEKKKKKVRCMHDHMLCAVGSHAPRSRLPRYAIVRQAYTSRNLCMPA